MDEWNRMKWVRLGQVSQRALILNHNCGADFSRGIYDPNCHETDDL